MRYLGAAYLVWLGIQAWRHAACARGPMALQILLLGLIFDLNGTVVNVGYAVAAGWLGVRLKARSGSTRWLNRAMGGLFVALGLSLAFADRR